MPITSKDILDQLADLQLTLEGYSFEQLNVEEARALKSYFEAFRTHLEEKIWNPKAGIPKMLPDAKVSGSGDAMGMITSVSHDLRNPLNGILGFTELLGATELNPDQYKYLRAIQLASKNSLEIVEELLQYNRLKSGTESGAKAAFDPVGILGEVREYMSAMLDMKPVRFELYIVGSLPENLVGDPSKLRRILMNLLENAVKYTGRGTIELVVRAARKKDGCTLAFELSDTGTGIPGTELPYIFKPYYQAGLDSKATRAGHGLGLSIVNKLIEEQKGEIEVESLEGQGTTFRIRLSYELPGPEGIDGEAEKPGIRFNGQLQGIRILVFEDNPLNQKLLETRLKNWGCTVHTATKVPNGIRLLQQEPIDLILMDIRMPLMDGFQAARRIREHRLPSVRKIPIIALTGDISSADGEKYRESGIDDLLLKPYVPETLFATIAHWIGSSTAREPASKIQCKALPDPGVDGRLVSLEYLEGECMGDSRMLSDLVKLFRNNLLEFAGRMKFYLKEENLQGIQASTHKVLSGLKLLGATQLLEVVKEIHQAVSEAMDLQRAALAYQEFLTLYPLVEAALESEMDKRK